jgi:putative transposase
MENRKWLRHDIPSWVEADDYWFVTLCCIERRRNSLATELVHKAIRESLLIYQDQGRLRVLEAVTMPDHLHLIAQFNAAHGMRGTVSNLKRYLARTHGIRWQEGFFDHRIRSHKAMRETLDYVRMNPVRAGLAKRPEDWPHRWSR